MSAVNILMACLFEIFGDFQFKFFARQGQLSNFGGGLVGYAGVIYFLIASLKQGNILWVNGMWDGISGLVESLAAIFILGERFHDWKQYVGLGMIVVGLYVLRRGGIAK
jgi:multidrug transporter EmrE-like cation transporter